MTLNNNLQNVNFRASVDRKLYAIDMQCNRPFTRGIFLPECYELLAFMTGTGVSLRNGSTIFGIFSPLWVSSILNYEQKFSNSIKRNPQGKKPWHFWYTLKNLKKNTDLNLLIDWSDFLEICMLSSLFTAFNRYAISIRLYILWYQIKIPAWLLLFTSLG